MHRHIVVTLALLVTLLLAAAALPHPPAAHANSPHQSSAATQCDTQGSGLCIQASATHVPLGTTVTFTVSGGSTLAAQGGTVAIADTTINSFLATCQIPSTVTMPLCTATAVYSDKPHTHGYVAYYWRPTTYYGAPPATVAPTAAIPPDATTPNVYVTWDNGPSATQCRTTLGQHCTAIWTDKAQYQVGDTVHVCYSVPEPAHITITDYPPGASSQVVADGNDDGTGGCLSGTVTPPSGTERVHLDVADETTGSPIGQADTSFQVLAAPATATPISPLVIPGGTWISPGNNVSVGPIVHFSAHAYPNPNIPGAPPIKQVNFTASWGAGWHILCPLTAPTHDDVYECDVDLSRQGAPAGPVQVSFDVYDTQYDPQHPENGHYNLAPQGEHTIYYSPPASPTATSTQAPPPTFTPTTTPTPTSTPEPTATNTPEPTPTPTPPEHFIMFISGICPEPTWVCGNPLSRQSPQSYASGFATLMNHLQNDSFHYTPAYFSYWIRTDQPHPRWYYPSDTHQNLLQSSWQLDSQLRAILKKHPHATFDLVAHSLGGVVGAFWATHYADDYMLGHIHSLITLDSPLQGVKGLTSEQIGMWFSGDVWGAIQPDSLYIKEIEGKLNGTNGAVDQLPGKVHTISDSRDGVVLSSQSWLPGAQDNKTITTCPLADWLGECHGGVLYDSHAIAWTTSWIESP